MKAYRTREEIREYVRDCNVMIGHGQSWLPGRRDDDGWLYTPDGKRIGRHGLKDIVKPASPDEIADYHVSIGGVLLSDFDRTAMRPMTDHDPACDMLPMPDDYWPDIVVQGAYAGCGVALGFELPRDLPQSPEMAGRLDRLRQAIWQGAEINRLRKGDGCA